MGTFLPLPWVLVLPLPRSITPVPSEVALVGSFPSCPSPPGEEPLRAHILCVSTNTGPSMNACKWGPPGPHGTSDTQVCGRRDAGEGLVFGISSVLALRARREQGPSNVWGVGIPRVHEPIGCRTCPSAQSSPHPLALGRHCTSGISSAPAYPAQCVCDLHASIRYASAPSPCPVGVHGLGVPVCLQFS